MMKAPLFLCRRALRAALLLAGWSSVAVADTQTFQLDPYWKLISFQVVPTNPNPAAVLVAAGFDYDPILRWEQTLYTKFTPADKDIDDWTTFDPNRDLWANVKSASFSLQPKLLTPVQADVDYEPFDNDPRSAPYQPAAKKADSLSVNTFLSVCKQKQPK